MIGRIRTCGLGLALVVGTALVAGAARADDFYQGKTITITTSTGPGGTYDSVARLLQRHMPRHIEGTPTIVVQNMPGAGNVLATNYMYTIAPKDGTAIATVNNAIPLNQVLDGRGVRYDASKFNWLGSPGTYNTAAIIWKTAGVRTIDDARKKEITFGGTGPGSSNAIIPTAMNAVLGTKFKLVLGYKSVAQIYTAMERGEVQGFTTSYSGARIDRPDWFRDNKVNIVAQVGAERDKDIKDVPLITEIAPNDEGRRILALISSPNKLGQPFLAPPKVPAARVAQLRTAFADTMRDKGFAADMAKLHIDLAPISGEDVAKIVDETIHQPAAVISKTKALMGTPG
ncbi:MAG TPA: tripartite tricarboxylate transporter substrate-binding protein [Alphaproteobacteria bacterium]|nr:tripartite tricarboxylate transporter substrate-binding protein [Alphaproteobacteria bacterium]